MPHTDVSLGRNLTERVCVGDITTRSADLYPEQAAIIDGDRTLTYKELDDQANRLGHALLGLGLERQDEDGAIWFTDRKKDVIKTGGENVASIEVERGLMGHPAVAEAAVIGVAHPHWGEAITAVVKLNPDMDADETALLEHSRKHLSGFQVPKKIVIVDEFPRTGTGKIQKNVIRGQLEDLYSSDNAASG